MNAHGLRPSRALLAGACWFSVSLAGCATTRLEIDRNDPASPRAATAPLPPVAQALRADFDPARAGSQAPGAEHDHSAHDHSAHGQQAPDHSAHDHSTHDHSTHDSGKTPAQDPHEQHRQQQNPHERHQHTPAPPGGKAP